MLSKISQSQINIAQSHLKKVFKIVLSIESEDGVVVAKAWEKGKNGELTNQWA
jgi:hypothetical protein